MTTKIDIETPTLVQVTSSPYYGEVPVYNLDPEDLDLTRIANMSVFFLHLNVTDEMKNTYKTIPDSEKRFWIKQNVSPFTQHAVYGQIINDKNHKIHLIYKKMESNCKNVRLDLAECDALLAPKPIVQTTQILERMKVIDRINRFLIFKYIKNIFEIHMINLTTNSDFLAELLHYELLWESDVTEDDIFNLTQLLVSSDDGIFYRLYHHMYGQHNLLQYSFLQLLEITYDIESILKILHIISYINTDIKIVYDYIVYNIHKDIVDYIKYTRDDTEDKIMTIPPVYTYIPFKMGKHYLVENRRMDRTIQLSLHVNRVDGYRNIIA